MSHKAVTWAWEQATGSPTRKAVLVSLADRHNKDTGRCDPSIARIVAETEFSDRAVRQALVDLEHMGLIERDERRRSDGSRRTYSYRFPHLAGDAKQAAPDAGSQVAGDAAELEVDLEPEVTPLAAEPRKRPIQKRGGYSPIAHAPPPTEPPPKPTRPRNEQWDALSHIFGEPTTRTAQKVRGKVVSSLRSAGATAPEIVARARRWPLHFDGAVMTDLALEKHWDTLGRKPLRRTG